MKTAGGIIAILAGIFGILAGLGTIVAGGIGAIFGANGAGIVIGLGWGGIFFSFLVIIFGAIAFSAKTKLIGILLLISSVLGGILGGGWVALFMVLAAVGGILVIVGTKSLPEINITKAEIVSDAFANDSSITTQAKNAATFSTKELFGTIILLLIVIFALVFRGQPASSSLKAEENPPSHSKVEENPLVALENAIPSNLEPTGELAAIFEIGGNSTDIQRENKLAEIRGKIVAWSLEVYDVRKDDDKYKIQTSGGNNIVSTFITLSVRNNQEKAFVEGLKTGSNIEIQGIIKDVSLRHIEIEPAILFKEKVIPVQTAANQPVPIQNSDPVEFAKDTVTTNLATNDKDNTNKQQVSHSSDQNSVQSSQELQTNKTEMAAIPVKPSFDCNKAIYIAEKMICDDPELAQLDNVMDGQYAQYLSSASDKNQAKSDQIAWIKLRNKCNTKKCINDAYYQRVEIINPEEHETHE